MILYFVLLTTVLFRAGAQSWQPKLDSGDHYRQQKLFKEALASYGKARLELRPDSFETATYIQVVRNMADICMLNFSDNNCAAGLYEEILPLIPRVYSTRLRKDYADVCHYLGIIYHETGQRDSAMNLYKQAKAIREKLFGNSSGPYAQSCNNLGSLYRDIGEFELAEQMLLEAMQIRKSLPPAGRLPAYAFTCTALANLYRDMGKFEQAESLYITGKNVREDTLSKNHPLYASSCNILADLYSYSYMGQFEKAERLYLEAKELRAKAGTQSGAYAETCANLGALYRDHGWLEKGEALLLEAKSILEILHPNGSPEFTVLLNNLGELYTAKREYTEAESCLTKAKLIWDKGLGKEHPYYTSNGDALARLYRASGQKGKADSLIRETAALKFKQVNRVFGFTSEAEKNFYIKNIKGLGDEYLSFYFNDFPRNQAGYAYDLTLFDRNLILSSLQQIRSTILSGGDPLLTRLFDGWAGAKQKLAKLYSSGAGTDDGAVRKWEQEADSLEKELSRVSVSFRKSQERPGWQQIQEHLKAGESAIEFRSFQYFNGHSWTDSMIYTALLLKKGLQEPVLISLFEKRQLDKLLEKRNEFAPAFINQLYSGTDLYNLIWRPLEKYLEGISRVYFAPAGNLHGLAFRALKTTDNIRLGDKYEMVQLLGTSSVLDESPVTLSEKDKVILYGDVQYSADSASLLQAAAKYGKGLLVSRALPDDIFTTPEMVYFKPLPNSRKEIDSIAGFASHHNNPVIVYRGVEANEESFKSMNGMTEPFLLHFSTHGFFNPDPRINKRFLKDPVARPFKLSDNPLFRGGLTLAGAENSWRGKPVGGTEDGILTAYEVSTMFFPENKLAVLSACRTALGDLGGHEGVYGLLRAFKMAGTKNLVMSLWDVPDEQAAEFMQHFYRNLFRVNSISRSFDTAYRFMKEKYRNYPVNWAGWILVQ